MPDLMAVLTNTERSHVVALADAMWQMNDIIFIIMTARLNGVDPGAVAAAYTKLTNEIGDVLMGMDAKSEG